MEAQSAGEAKHRSPGATVQVIGTQRLPSQEIGWAMTSTGQRPKENTMQDIKTTTFKGETVTVRELTVKQVREVFDRLDKESTLFIDDLLDQPVPALIVVESTGITLEALEESMPSEVIPLCKEVIEVNPSCASMIRRRVEAATRLQNIFLSAKNLTEQSAH